MPQYTIPTKKGAPNTMTDFEAIQRVNDLRARILAGDTIPADELREAYSALRSDRRAAASAPAKKKGKKKTVDINPLPDDISDLFS